MEILVHILVRIHKDIALIYYFALVYRRMLSHEFVNKIFVIRVSSLCIYRFLPRGLYNYELNKCVQNLLSYYCMSRNYMPVVSNPPPGESVSRFYLHPARTHLRLHSKTENCCLQRMNSKV